MKFTKDNLPELFALLAKNEGTKFEEGELSVIRFDADIKYIFAVKSGNREFYIGTLTEKKERE